MIKSFDEVFEDVTKLGVKIKTDEYHPIGKYQIIDQGQEAVAGYSDLEDGVFENVPAIVFGDHTRIVKYVDQPFFLGADGVKVLRSRFKDANYRYLYYALKSVKIPNTGYNRHFKWLKEAKIYYPNSEEQSKIVLILDGISSVIEHRQRQLQKLDELVKARFVEMFGDFKSITKVSLAEISDFVTVGIANSATHAYAESGIVMLRNQNIKENYLDERDLIYITPGFAKKYGSKKLAENDILVIRTGYPGVACLVPKKYEGCQTFTTLIVRLKVPTLAHANYVCHYINSSFGKDYVEQSKVGVAQQNFGAKALARMPIKIPSMALQEQFAAFVERVNKSKAAVQKALDEAQLLFDSLMQKYFE